MKKPTSTPHDAVFKSYLSHPDTARDFLRLYLPETLLKVCDLRTLHLESGHFVEDDLRPFYADILYSLKTTAGDGYIYALIEHQSTPDRHMAFRLMRYAIAAMQRHLDAGHDRLPLVIPVLFYHGLVSPYPFSLRWLDEFVAPELAGHLYHGAFPLADITVIPDDDIATHQRMATLELLQKAYSTTRSGAAPRQAERIIIDWSGDGIAGTSPDALSGAGRQRARADQVHSRAGVTYAAAQGDVDDNCGICWNNRAWSGAWRRAWRRAVRKAGRKRRSVSPPLCYTVAWRAIWSPG